MHILRLLLAFIIEVFTSKWFFLSSNSCLCILTSYTLFRFLYLISFFVTLTYISLSFCDISLSCNAVLHEVVSDFLLKIKKKTTQKKPNLYVFFKVFFSYCFHNLFSSLLCLQPVKILKILQNIFFKALSF